VNITNVTVHDIIVAAATEALKKRDGGRAPRGRGLEIFREGLALNPSPVGPVIGIRVY